MITISLRNLVGLGVDQGAQPTRPAQMATPVQATMERGAAASAQSYMTLQDELVRKAESESRARGVAEAQAADLRRELNEQRALTELARAESEEKATALRAEQERREVGAMAIEREMTDAAAHIKGKTKAKSTVSVKIEPESSSSDTDSDDISEAGTTASSTTGDTIKVKTMSASEITKAHMTKLEPNSIGTWSAWARPAMADYTPEWEAELDKSESAFFKECAKNPLLRLQDQKNARTLTTMLDADSLLVTNFHQGGHHGARRGREGGRSDLPAHRRFGLPPVPRHHQQRRVRPRAEAQGTRPGV
jgi:hypothetical protein